MRRGRSGKGALPPLQEVRIVIPVLGEDEIGEMRSGSLLFFFLFFSRLVFFY